MKLFLLRVILFFSLWYQLTAELIPFGYVNGDFEKKISVKNDVEIVDLAYEFKFDNKSYSKLYLNSNGLITFGKKIYYSVFSYPSQYLPPFVAAFWFHLDYSCEGDIFYREILEGPELEKIGLEIEKSFSNFFTPKWAFVSTWFEITSDLHYNRDKINTFQIVLTSDQFNSYAILNYDKMEWGRQFMSGISFGFNLYSEIINTNPRSILVENSNVGQKGKWIFNVASDINDTTTTAFTRSDASSDYSIAKDFFNSNFTVKTETISERNLLYMFILPSILIFVLFIILFFKKKKIICS